MDLNNDQYILLKELLLRNNFKIIEQKGVSIAFQSADTKLRLVHNRRENLYSLWIGDSKYSTEINDILLQNFFNKKEVISSSDFSKFSSSVMRFLINEGHRILKAGSRTLVALENFNIDNSKEYKKNLLHKQYLNLAEKAWDDKNYEEYVSYIEKTNIEKLLQSQVRKYKTAKMKLRDGKNR